MAPDSKRKRKWAAPLVLAAGALASVGGSVALSKWVSNDDRRQLHEFDDDLAGRIRSGDSDSTDRLMKLLSGLGEPYTLYPVSALAALWFVVTNRNADGILSVVATVGSASIDSAVKHMVKRRRPLPIFRHQKASGWSFPSKHSTMSLATYGTLGYMVVRRSRMPPEQATVRVWVPVAVLCAAVGYSRIALDVHYPSDVVGGWITSAIWLTACVMTRELMDGDDRDAEADRRDQTGRALPDAADACIIPDSQNQDI